MPVSYHKHSKYSEILYCEYRPQSRKSMQQSDTESSQRRKRIEEDQGEKNSGTHFHSNQKLQNKPRTTCTKRTLKEDLAQSF